MLSVFTLNRSTIWPFPNAMFGVTPPIRSKVQEQIQSLHQPYKSMTSQAFSHCELSQIENKKNPPLVNPQCMTTITIC